MMTGRRWNKKKRDSISLFHQLYPHWHALKRLKTTLHACFTNIKLIVCFAGQQLHQENVQLSHWFLNCLGQEKPTEKSFANHKIHFKLL